MNASVFCKRNLRFGMSTFLGSGRCLLLSSCLQSIQVWLNCKLPKNDYSPSVLSSLELARGCLLKSVSILSVLPMHQPSISFKYATKMKLQMGSCKTGSLPAALSSFKQYCGFIRKGDWADNDKSISSSFTFLH